MGRPTAHSASNRHTTASLHTGVLDLVQASLAPRTWATYETAIRKLEAFTRQYQCQSAMPLTPEIIALYLAFLHHHHYAPATLATHLAAISFVHKLWGFKDPADNFLVHRLMLGVRKVNPRFDVRLPISHTILGQLVQSLEVLPLSPWLRSLFRCMYLLAFFAFCRVGELTISHGNTQNVLTHQNVQFSEGHQSVDITFLCYKHSKQPATITVMRQPRSVCCPVLALQHYLALRGGHPGFLFLTQDCQPVQREFFTAQLSASLKLCGLNCSLYKSHSFRIGAACWAMRHGFSDAQIRSLGRWHSDAFKKYIRF